MGLHAAAQRLHVIAAGRLGLGRSRGDEERRNEHGVDAETAHEWASLRDVRLAGTADHMTLTHTKTSLRPMFRDT
jgi:hypothetical protein